MMWGYAAITWGDAYLQCIDETTKLGFKGVQLRGNAYNAFKDRPAELKQILQNAGTSMPIMSGGNLSLNPAVEQKEREEYIEKAEWVAAMGGKFLQITSYQPKEFDISTVKPADLERFGFLLTELGKATAKVGVKVVHHNHMETITEKPESIKVVHQATDPKYVGLLLDVAHYHQGRGNPAAAIAEYSKILSILHIKDVVTPDPQNASKPGSYRFVELGQGKVNLPSIFKALDAINYKGWGVVELDAVPSPEKTPLQCAQISLNYLKKLNVIS